MNSGWALDVAEDVANHGSARRSLTILWLAEVGRDLVSRSNTEL